MKPNINMHTRSTRVARVLLTIWICLILVACAQVPITNRQSIALLPESQLATMSLQEYDKVLKNSKLSSNRQQVEMVRRVGFRIATAAEAFLKEAGMQSEIKNLNWEFNLIEDDKLANAWVMPGGKAAVYTGILPFTKDETGLAVVLGHEVGHALANHGNERMSQSMLADATVNAASVAAGAAASEIWAQGHQNVFQIDAQARDYFDLVLEFAHGQGLIDDQDVRIDAGRNGKPQPYIHPGRIGLDGPVTGVGLGPTDPDPKRLVVYRQLRRDRLDRLPL